MSYARKRYCLDGWLAFRWADAQPWEAVWLWIGTGAVGGPDADRTLPRREPSMKGIDTPRSEVRPMLMTMGLNEARSFSMHWKDTTPLRTMHTAIIAAFP